MLFFRFLLAAAFYFNCSTAFAVPPCFDYYLLTANNYDDVDDPLASLFICY